MLIADVLAFLKTHGEAQAKSFTCFFRKGGQAPPASDLTFEHVSAGALIYLVIGVALLGSFHRRMSISEIPWLDVALLQIVFWVCIAIILWLLIRLAGRASTGGSFLVAFRVMPIAFVCGAFASALGYASGLCLRAIDFEINTLPQFFHILVAVAVTSSYMPRELRLHAGLSPASSRVVAVVVSSVYLAVNVVAFVIPQVIR
jgi:hypothetical protein